MKAHWFNSMSRAAQMLQEDLEAMKPAPSRGGRRAAKIVQTALSLAESGELDLGGDEMV